MADDPGHVSKQIRLPEDLYNRIVVAGEADHGRSFNNVVNMFIEKGLPEYENKLREERLLPGAGQYGLEKLSNWKEFLEIWGALDEEEKKQYIHETEQRTKGKAKSTNPSKPSTKRIL
jgi:hypothetical protein